MQIPEVGEAAEPFVAHRGASSTMPHKNNPVLSEAILALGKLLRQEAGLALDTLPADFERAGSGAWQIEWAAIPQSFVYCSAALKQTKELLDGLRVFPKKMKENLNMSQGMVAAEHVVVALAHVHGRSVAHDIIYDCCRKVSESGMPLAVILKETPAVTKFLSGEEIDWYCDPSNYLGLTVKMVDRVLAGR